MPLLGFIRKQDRTDAQHEAHARAEATMHQRHGLPIPNLSKGESVRLFDAWKNPAVVADVGFVFPRFHQLTGSCLKAGTPVRMANGEEKPIESVIVGDEVITHAGRSRRVMNTMHRYFTGDMITLHIVAFPFSLTTTADHEIPVLPIGQAWRWTPYDAMWKRADEIKEGERLLIGQDREWPEVRTLDMTQRIKKIEREAVENLQVYDFEVEEDHSFIANGLIVHNCVGAGGGQALFSLIATQRLLAENPTKAFIPFWPFDYGRCRTREGDRGQGEGAMGSSFAETVAKEGVIDASSQGLPAFKDDDGLVLSKSLEMAWSDGNSSLVKKWQDAARVHPVGSAAVLRNSQDVKAAILNGYPVTFACDRFIGHASVQGDGDNAILIGHWDSNGGHQQSLHGVAEHPTLGTLYWAQNNWPKDSYPSDPAGGPVCGCWTLEKRLDEAFNYNAEVYLLSHLAWIPAQPTVLDWYSL